MCGFSTTQLIYQLSFIAIVQRFIALRKTFSAEDCFTLCHKLAIEYGISQVKTTFNKLKIWSIIL